VTASQARNILGAPNTSAFGTYAYCASSHTDNDESSTSGWVMKRTEAVLVFTFAFTLVLNFIRYPETKAILFGAPTL